MQLRELANLVSNELTILEVFPDIFNFPERKKVMAQLQKLLKTLMRVVWVFEAYDLSGYQPHHLLLSDDIELYQRILMQIPGNKALPLMVKVKVLNMRLRVLNMRLRKVSQFAP